MSISTDGQICFGVLLDEDQHYPWDDYDGIEDWLLRAVFEYRPTKELFDIDGEWVDGKKPEQEVIDQYFIERRHFLENNPFPVELVNVCSGDCPIYILAIPESIKKAQRGYPESISPWKMNWNNRWEDDLLAFCDKYELAFSGTADWFLSAYWG